MARGTIRYWAAARAAAQVAEEPYDAATLADALQGARDRHAQNAEFGRVLDRCSFLVDGQPVGSREPAAIPLAEGSIVEVLPPFAGGAPGATGERRQHPDPGVVPRVPRRAGVRDASRPGR